MPKKRRKRSNSKDSRGERRLGFAIIKKLKACTTFEVSAAAMHAISEHRKMFRAIIFNKGTEFHSYNWLES